MRYPTCPPNMIESVLVPVVTLLNDSARSASQSYQAAAKKLPVA